MREILIYADGSCLGNGAATYRAASLALLLYQGHVRAVGEYLGQATNQQAEIVAAAIGLEALREPCSVLLRTTSKHVVNTMQHNWRIDCDEALWERLLTARKSHKVEWQLVRGAMYPRQVTADAGAREIALAGVVEPVSIPLWFD